MKKIFMLTLSLFAATLSYAQTDVSLFWKKDSLQITELHSAEADQYRKVGHHGPAVENMYMAARIYFNNSGAIDIYSKQKAGLELREYKWYPNKQQMANGAGCDEYRVGKTVGLGGISLWKNNQEVKLVATRGRDVRVVKGDTCSYIEMISRGVCYGSDSVDIAVRVYAYANKRTMDVEAECISGQKVQFMSGVNYHEGQEIIIDQAHIAVWGIHPADIVENPLPIGGGIAFDNHKWRHVKNVEENGMKRIVSVMPCHKVRTTIVAACSRESELNNSADFFKFVRSIRLAGTKKISKR